MTLRTSSIELTPWTTPPVDLNKKIPDEIFLNIFSFLTPCELIQKPCLTCKQWKLLAEDDLLCQQAMFRELEALKEKGLMLLDDRAWNRLIGTVKEKPPLPKNILPILHSPCPFWKDQKVYETHMLVLIPKMIIKDDKEIILTPNNFIQLASSKTRQFTFWDKAQEKYGNREIGSSEWLLIPKQPLPKSNVLPELKETIVQQISSTLGYTLPNILELSAAICLFEMESESRFFQDTLIQYACAKEEPIKTPSFNKDLRVTVSILPPYLYIEDRDYPYDEIGLWPALHLAPDDTSIL